MLQIVCHRAVMGDETDALPLDAPRLVEDEDFETWTDSHCLLWCSTRAPVSSSSACGIRCRIARRFSTAPFTLPGRFTMSADPRVVACARERDASGVFAIEAL